MNNKRPSWHSSRWRGRYNWKTNTHEILHDKPITCPYCGHRMTFHVATGYGTHSSDSYWTCLKCLLSLPNREDFSQEFLDNARKNYREYLEKRMREIQNKFKRYKNLYNQYGRYFTPEEKRNRLIETIQEHGNKVTTRELTWKGSHAKPK